MRETRRIVAAAAASAAFALALGTPALAAPPTSDPDIAADLGAGWLSREVTSEGFIPSPTDATQPDYANTANAVLAFAAAGVAENQAEAALGYLEAHVDEAVQAGESDAPGPLATLILAVDALGDDPRNFGGEDLVARLLATQQADGPDAGLFGSQDPTFDGAYRQGLALMALVAVGENNDAGEQWLIEQQCEDGGWTAYRAETTVPCPPPSPSTFTGPDSNSTAVALSGLAAAGAEPAQDVVEFLESTQGADGGWAYIPATDQQSDPNSTALVIQALFAAGLDPTGDARFDESGGDPLSRLLAFQLGCEAAEDAGAFFFPVAGSDPTPNMLATVQAVPAAAGEPFPIDDAQLTTDQPSVPCPFPGPRAEPRSPVPAAPATRGGDVARQTLPATGPERSTTGELVGAAIVLLVAGALVRAVVRPSARP
jgi:hypothetical protein